MITGIINYITLILILVFIWFNLILPKFRSFRRMNRIVLSGNNIKYKKPIYYKDVSNIVKDAIFNNYKVTVISGGHSAYMMNHFEKFNIKNLVIIDTINLKQISKKDNILNIEAGVNSGEIRKFNLQFEDIYCLHGGCDTVGLGFWINGGPLSGVGGYKCFKDGLYGSDLIRGIKYIDYKGNYKSITKESGEIFEAMKKFGGEYGVILSIDVEMIKEKLPEGKCYLVKVNLKNAKKYINIISNSKELNSDGIVSGCSYNQLFGFLIIGCVYEKSKFKKNPIKIIERLLNKRVLILLSLFFIHIIFGVELSKSYRILYNNKWNECNILIPNKEKEIINKLIDLCSTNNRTIHVVPKVKASVGLCNIYKNIDYAYIGLIFMKNDDGFKKIENIIKDCPNIIRYFNTPGYKVPIESYFNYSNISYENMKKLKNIHDPNGIFVNRGNVFK